MTHSPQQLYDAYRRDPYQDMYAFSPFLRLNTHGNILEIGVRGGVSTAAFLLGIEKNGGHLFSVDKNPECGKLFDHPQWDFIPGDSRDLRTVSAIKAAVFDIIFIDGDHTREGIRSDLEKYASLAKDGGLVLVHDIDQPPGVTEQQIAEGWASIAVREEYLAFAEKMGWPHFELPGTFGMGMMVRT